VVVAIFASSITATATTVVKMSAIGVGPISLAGLVTTGDDVTLTMKLVATDPSTSTIPTEIAAPGSAARPAGSGPSFAHEVAPILAANCASCHRSGEVGAEHWVLDTAGDAAKVADGIGVLDAPICRGRPAARLDRLGQQPAVQEHPNGFDGVQRDSLGPAQNLLGRGPGTFGGVGELNAAGLSSPTDQYLSLYGDRPHAGRYICSFLGRRSDLPGRHRDTDFSEQSLTHIFLKFQSADLLLGLREPTSLCLSTGIISDLMPSQSILWGKNLCVSGWSGIVAP